MNKLKAALAACTFLLIASSSASSQDTLKMMVYNLLNYGNNFGNCNSSTNDIADKDVFFKVIAKHASPDVLVVNEMGASSVYAKRILENVLNTDGVDRYARAELQNNGFSNIVNMCFYNKEKLVLLKQEMLDKNLNGTSIVRVIDFYTFYYKDSLLAPGSDTAFFTVVAAHLKAGDSSSDRDQRASAAAAVMAKLEADYLTSEVFFCGDLNLKTSTEQAYVTLTDAIYGMAQLNDPVMQEGSWNNNSGYSAFHTQSTRLGSTNGGCFSGGGLDDRFDFILANAAALDNDGDIYYVGDSYKTLGQDGQHFNQDLSSGGNNSAPSSVISALYEMSDHLPVQLKFGIQTISWPAGIVTDRSSAEMKVVAWNDILAIASDEPLRGIAVLNMSGSIVAQERIPGSFQWRCDVSQFPSGIYLLRVETEGGTATKKIFIN